MKKPLLALLILLTVFLGGLGPTWGGEAVQLRILYFNDFHGFAEAHQPVGSSGKIGGIAYLASEVKRLGQERPTLLLAAGDLIQGHPWANLFEGQSTLEVLNALNLSAMVVGNHEFDFGQEALKKIINEARFPVLAANVQGFPGLQTYTVKDIAGLKVVILGLVTGETPTATHPKNVIGLTFTPVQETAAGVLKNWKGPVDLIICLSHLGFPEDRRLAETVPGIQVIVGGHTHTRLESPVRVGETLIVQAWEHSKALGLLDLTIQDGRIIRSEGRLIPIGPGLQDPDPEVEAIVNRYVQRSAALLEEVIGIAHTDLQAAGSRNRETTMGNLITDIIRQDTKADCVLINGGGIRADILKGPVRMKDPYSVLPFSTYQVVIKVSGQELKKILEHGLSNLSGYGGQFPQISGMRLEYSSLAPVGQRIRKLWVQDRPWEPQAWYTLATNDYLIAGGDGYGLFKEIIRAPADKQAEGSRLLLMDSGRELRDIVISYIKKEKQISAFLENRIKKID
jgi:2',3'-cyclic-nucleotide 2'-phosphodiesterase (5'-nucleotidase family)